jgi:radical SAM superfamily enzyme YgiQ (UPF0313 family)
MDVLFVHCPKFDNYYRPLGDYIFVNYLPMGVLALADLLDREGYESEVVHLGVEWIEDQGFSLIDYVAHQKPTIVALSLFWHPQSYEVLEQARRIKEAFPEVFVLLGGMTAGFYHREIMEGFPCVDAVIRGEGEIPLVQLTKAVIRGGDLATVPNLTWRKGERIVENPLDYQASQAMLNELRFTNFALLKNHRIYIDWVLMPFFVKGFSKERNRLFFSLKTPMLDLMVGRGCPVNCTWCGGGRDAQRIIAGRREVMFRDQEQVMDSIREALGWGYETMHVCFDPYPRRPDYYLQLFARIREERLPVEFFFESFGLPTKEFIAGFAQTFGPRSLLAISPESGSEEVRRRNKGYSYSNRELWDCLEYTKDQGVMVDLFFGLGLPFECEEDLHETARLITRVRRHFPNVRGVRTFTIQMEPGAPWHLHPEAFGVQTTLQTFSDFYHYHQKAGEGFSAFGYHIPGYFPDLGEDDGGEFQRRLQAIKCRRFCFIHPDARKSSSPFWGRMLCRTSALMARVGKWLRA